jgi:hypothetical protein
MMRAGARQLRARLEAALAARLSPERTRRATRLERLTVQRLTWDRVVWLHRYLELFGKLATAVWVMFVLSLIVGVDWKQTVEAALNSGKPMAGAIVLAVLGPTLVFLIARSALGFARWRLQRELWRRDVERLSAAQECEPAPQRSAVTEVDAAQPSAPGAARLPPATRS